jgi:hypothetical protein
MSTYIQEILQQQADKHHHHLAMQLSTYTALESRTVRQEPAKAVLAWTPATQLHMYAAVTLLLCSQY